MSAATFESDSMPKVPTLTGRDNYSLWLTRVRFAALRLGLDDHLVSGATVPSSIPLADDKSNILAVNAREREILDWHKNARKAAGLVCTHIGDGPLGELGSIIEKDNFTAREVLDVLDKKYVKTNVALTSFYTLERLLATKYEDGEPVQPHINKIRDTLKQQL